MNAFAPIATRAAFLARVVRSACTYLSETDRRLFAEPMTAQRVALLARAPELAERVDAFVGRFGRLQDTLGDKVLPMALALNAERVGTVAENLDQAERIGWIESADAWLALRRLRNQMVHEYIDDPVVLADALSHGHLGVATLLTTAERLLVAVEQKLPDR